MNKARAHITITGMVQGVFFRSYTKEMARELNLTGWVKNSWDGSVEVLLEGDRDAIDKMTSWFYKGPPSASVENVEIEWKKPTGEFDTFYVNY